MPAKPSPTPSRPTRERVCLLVLPIAVLAAAAQAQTAAAPPLGQLAPALAQGIHETLQDEYRGQAFYQRFLNDHGEVRPFANIVRAEGRHAAMLVALLEARGLAAPASRFEPGSAPAFATRQEACAAAVTFEKENVALYDKHLAGEMPDDVRRVFVHNRDASLHHHLPAFERCAGPGGATASAAGGGRGHGRHGAGSGCGHQGCGGGSDCGHHGQKGRCGRGAAEPAPHH